MKKFLLILAIPFMLSSCEGLNQFLIDVDANQYKFPNNNTNSYGYGNDRKDPYIVGNNNKYPGERFNAKENENVFSFGYYSNYLEIGKFKLNKLDSKKYSRVYSKFNGIKRLYIYVSDDGVAAVTDENLNTEFIGRDGRRYYIGIVRSDKNNDLFVSNYMYKRKTYRLQYYLRTEYKYSSINLDRDVKIFNAGYYGSYWQKDDVRANLLDKYRYERIYYRFKNFEPFYLYVNDYRDAIVTNVDRGLHPYFDGQRYSIGIFRNTDSTSDLYYTNYFDFRADYNIRYDIRRSDILD